MLVVVIAVAGVPVLAVLVVGVPGVLHQGVAAAVAVHVHMSRVGDVEGGHRGRDIVHVIHVEVVDMAIVEVVEVVPVGDRRVAAPRVVGVVVRRVGMVGKDRGLAHG